MKEIIQCKSLLLKQIPLIIDLIKSGYDLGRLFMIRNISIIHFFQDKIMSQFDINRLYTLTANKEAYSGIHILDGF